jgi:hypothetical protein
MPQEGCKLAALALVVGYRTTPIVRYGTIEPVHWISDMYIIGMYEITLSLLR